MSDHEIVTALKSTLSDHRLSRGEKQALAKLVGQLGHDEKQLADARRRAFQIARGELVGPEAIAVVDWLDEVMQVLWPKSGGAAAREPAEVFFSPDDNCVGKITRMFETARTSVDVCVFTITDDRITEAIIAAHDRNVTIRVVSDNDKSNELGSDIAELKHCGIEVRMDESDFHMHHKFAIFDRQRVLTGSYNWTRSAAKYNEENFIVSSDANLVNAYQRAFDKLWKEWA